MQRADFMAAVVSLARSAKGQEQPELVRLAERYRDGELEHDAYQSSVSQVRARVLMREGPHMKPWPRNQQTEDFCDMRRMVVSGQSVDRSVKHAGEKGRKEYERWHGQVANAFDVRAALIREFWTAGRREDIEAYNALLGQGDRMQSFYRGLHVPWWPKHVGEKYGSVLEAWGELKQHFRTWTTWQGAA